MLVSRAGRTSRRMNTQTPHNTTQLAKWISYPDSSRNEDSCSEMVPAGDDVGGGMTGCSLTTGRLDTNSLERARWPANQNIPCISATAERFRKKVTPSAYFWVMILYLQSYVLDPTINSYRQDQDTILDMSPSKHLRHYPYCILLDHRAHNWKVYMYPQIEHSSYRLHLRVRHCNPVCVAWWWIVLCCVQGSMARNQEATNQWQGSLHWDQDDSIQAICMWASSSLHSHYIHTTCCLTQSTKGSTSVVLPITTIMSSTSRKGRNHVLVCTISNICVTDKHGVNVILVFGCFNSRLGCLQLPCKVRRKIRAITCWCSWLGITL